jgi:murein DD-endopeptidase MepM/ murein hydrolase activator NlpD
MPFNFRKLPSQKIKRALKILAITIVTIFVVGLVYVNCIREQQELSIPVAGATNKNWDRQSYWHSPWGKSGVHKGIDIFAEQKTEVVSPVSGLIISAGYSENGGNYIYIIGPKLRTYYFAHLNTQEKSSFSFVKKGEHLGVVGNSGNAVGTPYHLHFSIFSLLPIIRNYSKKEPSGWKKMFYLDPEKSLITN